MRVLKQLISMVADIWRGILFKNVRLIDKKTVTGITEIDSPKEDTDEIYTISGMKVKEAKEKGDLRPGVYIIDGKKGSREIMNPSKK